MRKKNKKSKEDKYIALYGLWANHGWGIMLLLRKDLTDIAFTDEESETLKIVDNKLYSQYLKDVK